MPETPRIGFLIGGVQKGGTTALAHYLAAHPGIALPRRKEAHVFDAGDFDDAWTPAQVDARFAPCFDGDGDGHGDARLHGDATPLTVYHPRLVERVARYNPGMRWLLLLRDPVERAISHYFMERGRGAEPLGLAAAVLAEPGRLRGHADDWTPHSPLRTWSYVDRGRYARQLDVLFRHFDRGQVLLLRSGDLAARPADTVARALDFLGLPPFAAPAEFPRIFAGDYAPVGRWSPGRWLLRWRLRGEVAALRRRHGVDLRADGGGGQA